MPKNIAIVTPVFPPYRGGMGTVAENDARQLASLGFAVDVYAPGLAASPAGKGGYTTNPLHSWFRYGNAAFAPFAANIFRKHDAVLLHYPFFGTAEPLAMFHRHAGKSRAKLLLTYHMDVVGAPALKPFFAAHSAVVMPRIIGAADRVLVTSADYARTSRIASLFRSRPNLFRELPPGVDVARFSPGPKDPALLARYSIAQTDRVISFVGGLDKAHYFKGVPSLLRALASEQLEHARLLVAGDGDLRPVYETYAKEIGVSKRVTFTGSVSDAELAAHHRLGDVFAFPSVDRSEAFGIAALEAMACGVPVVASDLPGVRTIVREGVTGMRVPPGSASALVVALTRMLADDAHHLAMSDAGRAMAVKEYANEVRQERWKTIMDELLS